MAKHIYDENGNYKGKILSQEEHNKEIPHHTISEAFSLLIKTFFFNLSSLFFILSTFQLWLCDTVFLINDYYSHD